MVTVAPEYQIWDKVTKFVSRKHMSFAYDYGERSQPQFGNIKRFYCFFCFYCYIEQVRLSSPVGENCDYLSSEHGFRSQCSGIYFGHCKGNAHWVQE